MFICLLFIKDDQYNFKELWWWLWLSFYWEMEKGESKWNIPGQY